MKDILSMNQVVGMVKTNLIHFYKSCVIHVRHASAVDPGDHIPAHEGQAYQEPGDRDGQD